MLQKQEQIQGPENASIARFDGLGCYQTDSETNRETNREINREINRETGGSFRRALAQRTPGIHPGGPLAFANQNLPARGLSFIALIDSRECMHRVS